jgi:hypothetical protein
LGAGAIAAILLAIGGAIGAAVILNGSNQTEVGGGIIIVSPSR